MIESKLFPSLNKSREDNSLDKLNEKIKGNLFKTVEYEISGLLMKIDHLDDIDSNILKEIILKQHSMILNYDLFLLNRDTRSQALKLFTNRKFLKAFLEVAGVLSLSDHEKICLNKIAYDYYTYMQKDPEISDMLYQLTTWVNNKEVLVLSGMIGMNGAKILAMIRNSSFKEEKCIHRVNTFIIRCGIDMSVQDIINIVCFLFKRFTPVFVYTMLETKPAGLTNDQSNRFDAISIAILSILDSMDSYSIKKVLYDYAYNLNMVRVGTLVRFSLHTLDSRYERIIKIINEIEICEEMRII
ncbi:MAG: hypothetical protein IKR19_08875 [Acholeplasmatales bacterium]|nr:hypothetical protein [Acholeplasmatales bacterium]